MSDSEIGQRLQWLREHRHPVLSRRVTSELMGLATNSLARYERGEVRPSAEALVKIADYYDVTVDWILGR